MDSTQSQQEKYFKIVTDESQPVTQKYMAFFHLKNIGGLDSAELLKKALPFQGDSELLRHEIVYTLGQMKLPELGEWFKTVMDDESEFPVVRHEAAEALAYLNDKKYIENLSKYLDSKVEVLKETCQVAVARLKDERVAEVTGLNYGGTLEPAAPFSKESLIDFLAKATQKEPSVIQEDLYKYIWESLINLELPLYKRYQIMYYLRDAQTDEAIRLLGKYLDPAIRDATSVTLRHEVGFIAGQLAEKAKIIEEDLKKSIEDETENPIVRHEAISGYSSCSDNVKYLEKFLAHESKIVRESAIVAVDMIDYWKSDAL